MPTIQIISPVVPEGVLPVIDRSNVDDVGHFIATYNHALRFCHSYTVSVTIFLGQRTEPKYTNRDGEQYCYDEGGWLEHIIQCEFADGGKLTVGAIQRKPGERSEFHS